MPKKGKSKKGKPEKGSGASAKGHPSLVATKPKEVPEVYVEGQVGGADDAVGVIPKPGTAGSASAAPFAGPGVATRGARASLGLVEFLL